VRACADKAVQTATHFGFGPRRFGSPMVLTMTNAVSDLFDLLAGVDASVARPRAQLIYRQISIARADICLGLNNRIE
jgi:hypothetical protein